MDDSQARLTLMCYNDTHGYGWRHVDLFLHDASGRELNWVHWQADADGPEAADRVTAAAEPSLRRTSEWRHGVSASGMDYWSADAAWSDR
ncbi:MULTISPECIES: hypothetical protein [Nocardia]|nr:MULTISPECIES: hypothetical protein [Nocardia]MBF6139965.1 hypothetical protein [Nocardia farcinica]MBF6184123.1 hypothetical protein [Nocardia farcinica]MBF6230554.1 hypothetical protein [Nocardia farcinica]MBF6258094.1 hypothetical protein [Nocardia farcinica]MBF6290769.1 hypothetical protein [Nocardia farcinica]